MRYDVIIVGGGPAGLSAALALGRARKRVLLCDSGPRRNARAEHLYNFVTRDGTPPSEFRRIGRQQLAPYPNVECRDVAVASIGGERDAFSVNTAEEVVFARRVLLCTGMIDELPATPGFAELWGHSIVQCPYCHGWEAQDQRWGYLLRAEALGHVVPFVMQLRGWTSTVHLFTNGLQVPEEVLDRLSSSGVGIVGEPVVGFEGESTKLRSIDLADGGRVPCDVLFAHPPQRQVPLVSGLGLVLDAEGFVVADAMTRQTSIPGMYAAGDLTTRMQAAIAAAATGTQAAAMINVDLSLS